MAQLAVAGIFKNEPLGFVFWVTEVHDEPAVAAFENRVAGFCGVGEQAHVAGKLLLFQFRIVYARMTALWTPKSIVGITSDGMMPLDILCLKHSEQLAIEYRLLDPKDSGQSHPAPAQAKSRRALLAGLQQDGR